MRWLRRIALTLAILLGAVLVLVAIALTGLNTRTGQRVLLDAGLPFLEKSTGISADIGGTAGSWPQDILLTDVKLKDGEGVWLEGKRLRLRWCVTCALGGDYVVKELSLAGGGLWRQPILPQAADTPPEAEPGALPALRVEMLAVSDFAIGPEIVEGGSTLDLTGAAHTEEGRRVLAALTARLGAPGGAEGPVGQWVGEVITLDAEGSFDRFEGAGNFDRLAVSGDRARFTGSGLRYGADGDLGGRIALSLTLPDGAPEVLRRAAGDSLHLTTDLSGNLPQGAGLQNTALENATGERLLSGSARVHDLADAPRLEAGFAMTPALANALSGNWVPSGPVEVRLAGENLKDAPGVTATIAGPGGVWNGNPIPAFRADLTLADAIKRPHGTLRLSAREGEEEAGRGVIAFALEGGERLHIPSADLRYGSARVAGDALIEVSPFSAQAQFDADLPDLSELPQFAAIAGDLKANGRVRWAEKGGSVSAGMESKSLAVGPLTLTGASAKAEGPLERLRVEARAAAVDGLEAGDIGEAEFRGTVSRTPEAFKARIEDFALRWSGTAIRLTEATEAVLREGDARLGATRLAWGEEGQFSLQGRLGGSRLEGQFEARGVKIPPAELLIDGTGTVDTRAREAGTFALRLTPLGPEAPEVVVDLDGSWDGRQVALEGGVEGFGALEEFGRHRILRGRVPFALHREGGGLQADTRGAADLAIRYEADAAPLFALARVPDQTLAGTLDLDFQIRGPLDALEAGGAMTLSKGVYEHLRAGTRLTDMTLRLEAAGSAADPSLRLTLRANDGSAGRSADADPAMTGEGRLKRTAEGVSVDAALALDKAEIIRRDDFEGTFSGNARLSGTLPRLALTGSLKVDALEAYIPDPPPGQAVDVTVVRVDAGGEATAPEPEVPPVLVDLDLKVKADGRVFIRGRGLDSEWTSALSVGGTSTDPKLDGPVAIKRGTFEFGGRVFDLERGRILFVPLLGTDPSLDIRAKADIPTGESVYVTVSGRASAPELTLSSVPALPEEDVMALILFGKAATKLSAFESLQVANAVATLSGKGPLGGSGPGVLDRARNALGLDVLQIGAGENGLSDAGLTVGKYVAEGVRVSASQDVSGKGGEVTVEVEVTDSISVETDVGQDASGSVSVFWSRDY